jgi:hypothetical protein
MRKRRWWWRRRSEGLETHSLHTRQWVVFPKIESMGLMLVVQWKKADKRSRERARQEEEEGM